MVPNSNDPYQWFIIKPTSTKQLDFLRIGQLCMIFPLVRHPDCLDRPLPFATGSFPPVSWKNGWFPSKVLIYTWVTISWYQDLPFQAIPSFIWRGNLGQKTASDHSDQSKWPLVMPGVFFLFFDSELGGVACMGSWLVKKLSSKQHALFRWRLFRPGYLLFEQQEGDQLAFFGRFCFNLLFAASKLWRCCDFVVKSWDVEKIQAHLWNSVAGINVGMGYFFYFVGVVWVLSSSKKWMARGQGGSQKVIFPAFRFVSWQETSIPLKRMWPLHPSNIEGFLDPFCNIKSQVEELSLRESLGWSFFR